MCKAGQLVERYVARLRPCSFENPFGFANVPGRRDPAAHPVVEEYQIAFWCDNLLLLLVTSEITLERPL